MTMYDLAKYDIKTRKVLDARVRHYPTVLRAMRWLDVGRLVKIVGRRKGKKGAPTILYDITKLGLLEVIPYLGSYALRQAAEKHRDLLPGVFPFWPEFIEAKVEDLAVRRLKEGLKEDDDLDWDFFNPQSFHEPKRWNDAVRTNEKLKQATREYLLERIDSHAGHTKGYLELLFEPHFMFVSEEEAHQKLEAIIQELRAPKKTLEEIIQETEASKRVPVDKSLKQALQEFGRTGSRPH
jgi:hypothetical protein